MQNQAIKAPAVFTPAAVAAINEGFAEACRIARATDSKNELRFRLADQVMFLARNGELDPGRLSTQAVSAVMREVDAQRSDAVTPSAAVPGATGVGDFGKAP